MKLMIKKATGKGVGSLLFLSCVTSTRAACPFLEKGGQQHNKGGCPHSGQLTGSHLSHELRSLEKFEGDGGVPEEGFGAVKEDIMKTLTESQDFFPADFEAPHGPNYGGLMIRLAWHCSGSYRASDGRGGCDGARIRFDPELDWEDNANLDKAMKILEPIKEKYGAKLSWGDLIILAGTTAIESMGGPILGFCGGRIDEVDGANSLKLGPSEEQEAIAPCQSLEPSRQGMCLAVPDTPLGPTTVGLIYVNPAGPVGSEGDPVASGEDVRKSFSNMGMNDTETAALVGGGHAFGKCHGACSTPPCGKGTDMEGIGPNTFTSGFEGQWTRAPTTWNNEYFKNLFDYEWSLVEGPGGQMQWEPTGPDGSALPSIIMLTADLALARDSKYEPISREFANDQEVLDEQFKHAWYKLTTADMGPASRCLGDDVPPAQAFQQPLPSGPSSLPDFVPIRTKIQEILDEEKESNSAAFVNLAYRCAYTFRQTDYKGGCNGARIRFPPEADFPGNEGTSETIKKLQVVKDSFPEASWADIIVLAGQTAIEGAGGNDMPFCPGRVDAPESDTQNENLAPRFYEPTVVSIRDDMQVKGLTAREGVALAGRPTSSVFSNQFFKDLQEGKGDFSDEELALLQSEFKLIVEQFAADEEMFKKEFAGAWLKMMNADRFDGPRANACDDVDVETKKKESSAAVQSMYGMSKFFLLFVAGIGSVIAHL